jgi:hypothetical protein
MSEVASTDRNGASSQKTARPAASVATLMVYLYI